MIKDAHDHALERFRERRAVAEKKLLKNAPNMTHEELIAAKYTLLTVDACIQDWTDALRLIVRTEED